MSGGAKLDGRRARALDAELRRRATAVLSGDGRPSPLGPVANAIFDVAARIGEEVTQRLDRAPAKQAANFYNAAGIGRDPARPASLPIAFRLAETSQTVLSARAGTRLMAEAGGPVILETERRIDLVPGRIAALRGLDAASDSIAMPADRFVAAAPPRKTVLERRLLSGAAAGATKIQIDPVAGLEPGMFLLVGEGAAAREHKITALEGALITIEPGLKAAVEAGAPAVEADSFAPFGPAARNHQLHALYLGHAKLLDIESALKLRVTGASLPEGTVWSWWGKTSDEDPPDWQELGPVDGALPVTLQKEAGKLDKKQIGGCESLWLRALLPGPSSSSVRARDIRIAIGGECERDPQKRCAAALGTGFEAIAVTTPVVLNQPFHPFGREPRLYDSFYVGADEAFSKAGAGVSLCFEFGGPDLGRLASVSAGGRHEIFGVGSDGILYRVAFAGTARPTMEAVARPAEAGRLPPRAPVSARLFGTRVELAVGCADAVATASLDFAGKVEPASVAWAWRNAEVEPPADAQAIAVIEAGGAAAYLALIGRTLVLWRSSGGYEAETLSESVRALEAVQGSVACLFVEEKEVGSGRVDQLFLWSVADPAGLPFASLPAGTVPGSILGAWASQPDLKPLWIAGSTPGTGLTFHRIDADSEHERIEPPFPESSLPVAFEPPPDGAPGAVPAARIATAEPRLFLPEPQGYVEIAEPVGIGFSTNPHRHFLRVGEHLVVQRAEPGLLYRRSRKEPGLDRFAVQVRERIAAIEAADVPGDLFAIRKSDEPGQRESFRFAAADGYRFVKLPEEGGALPNADEVEFVAVAGATGGTVRRSGSRLILTAEGGDIQDPDPLFILLRRERAGEVTEDYGAWELRRRSSGADWAVPPGFPSEMEGLRFTLLERQQVDLIEAVRPADLAAVQEPMQSGPLRPANRPSWTIPGLVAFEGFQYLILPLGQVVDGQLELLSPPQRWSELGPDRPANPGLSWEYWNGTAWWALGRGALVDGTASFQQNGEVFFTVPKDLEPTDVAGRKSHWIRARLVGGDYGEAKVTVLTRPGAVAGTTEQVATRDVGTVRAPFVTSLKLGYCLEEPVRPQLVLTEDNLGFIDQTSANEAGLEFPVFTPVSEIMNPAPAPDKPASDDDSGRCGDPCPPPAPETDPCAAPGAWESCDSPCLPHGAGRRSADGAAPAGFTRGLMIGFERAFAGETVSLHVDAASGSGSVELAAEILRDGRFVPATIVSDESHGLSESGIVTLSLPAPPDRAEMLGASAHWLRLRPKSDGGSWAPRLYGVRLNAVIARALETREMERVGSSIGLPDHEFRLAESPVAPDMLELRIRERLSAEERDEQGLDVVAFPDGPAGDWVRWARVDELTERDGPQRAFTLDPERGILRFGDGKAGRIPPPGAEIMAVRYAKVTGASANGIRAGAELQLMAPLAGVDTVVALDESAGGADAETSEGALRRAPAKIRHGGRILTLADLEEWGKGAVPGVAQLVAERRRGSVRLILAMAGGDPRPSQAQLRAVAAAARIVSSYGLARPGGLSVVAPRLLAIGVEVELEARRPELFAEAAEQARAALARLFDAATGGHGGTGWPIGRLPDEQDVAAALSPIEPLAFATALRLFRRGGRGAADESLPPSIPSDVLVRLDPADVAVARAREAAA